MNTEWSVGQGLNLGMLTCWHPESMDAKGFSIELTPRSQLCCTVGIFGECRPNILTTELNMYCDCRKLNWAIGLSPECLTVISCNQSSEDLQVPALLLHFCTQPLMLKLKSSNQCHNFMLEYLFTVFLEGYHYFKFSFTTLRKKTVPIYSKVNCPVDWLPCRFLQNYIHPSFLGFLFDSPGECSCLIILWPRLDSKFLVYVMKGGYCFSTPFSLSVDLELGFTYDLSFA